MPNKTQRESRTTVALRALMEIAGIIFLFYSNLLMGEFNRSNGRGKTMAHALQDVVTVQNAAIAVVTATGGYLIFEALRRRLTARREDENRTLL